MEFFADTAIIDEINQPNAYGLLDGVTTNPSLIAKSGRDFKEVVAEICAVVEGPVSAHVKEAAFAGADVATIPAGVIKSLVNHVLTDKGLVQFAADWEATGQTIVFTRWLDMGGELEISTLRPIRLHPARSKKMVWPT